MVLCPVHWRTADYILRLWNRRYPGYTRTLLDMSRVFARLCVGLCALHVHVAILLHRVDEACECRRENVLGRICCLRPLLL